MELSNVIANAVNGTTNNPTPIEFAAAVDSAVSAGMTAAIAAEIARLKAENEKLAAKKSAKPAATAAVSAPFVPPTGVSAADAKLLEIIAKFKSPARTDGKVPGTFAVKVHAYLHACGVPEPRVRQIIEDAAKRNVISRMSIPTKNNTRMMLYFDAREKPAYELKTSAIPVEEKTSVAALFAV